MSINPDPEQCALSNPASDILALVDPIDRAVLQQHYLDTDPSKPSM